MTGYRPPSSRPRPSTGPSSRISRPASPAIADVSPSYLRNAAAAARLHAFAPEARILILLREPAAKVFSQYVHLWSAGRETLPFEEAFALSAERREAGFSDMFDYEGGGYYAAPRGALPRPLRARAGPGGDLRGDWSATWAWCADRLEDFLGVSLPATDLPQTNAGGRAKSPLVAVLLGNERLRAGLRRTLPLGLRTRLRCAVRRAVTFEKPELQPATRASLRRRYAGDVAELEALLGRPTGWPAA